MFYVLWVFFNLQRPVQYQKTSWEHITYDYDGLMRKKFILKQEILLNLNVFLNIIERHYHIHSEPSVGKGNWHIPNVDKTMVKMLLKIKICTFTQNFSLSIQVSVYFVNYCVIHLHSYMRICIKYYVDDVIIIREMNKLLLKSTSLKLGKPKCFVSYS